MDMNLQGATLFSVCLLFPCAQLGADPGSEQDEFLGGPNSVGWDLESDERLDEASALEYWTVLKERLAVDQGFDIGFDYATLYQAADSSVTGVDDAASGVFRLFGKWTLLGHGTSDTGKLVWKAENRHRIGGKIPPSQLGAELGYVGVTGISFNDTGTFLAPLYWEQMFRGENSTVGFVVGRLDPLDFVDISGYSSQWRRFQNPSVLASSALFFPDLGFGAGAGFTLDDQWSIGATIHDANGEPDRYGFFDGGSEFYTTAYVSWAPTRAKRFERELHLTGWHVDERTQKGTPSDRGLSFGATWLIDDQIMPFTRLAWADGNAARADASLVLGALVRPSSHGELGLAWNWESLSARSLGEQQAFEAFYRWDINDHVSITPSFQVLFDPALNPADSAVVLGGLRARLTF